MTAVQSALQVRVIAKEEYPWLAKKMEEWEATANKIIDLQPPEKMTFRKEEYVEMKGAQCLYHQICEDMHSYIRNGDGGCFLEIYGCFNGKRLEGVMKLFRNEPKSIFIDKLFTHPDNLKLSSKKDKVKGVGRACMDRAKEIFHRTQACELEVSMLSSSRGFYEKMGFVEDPSIEYKMHIVRENVDVEKQASKKRKVA